MKRGYVFLLSTMLLLFSQAALAVPVVQTISGTPLQIHIGDDASFQIFNTAIPGQGQMFPSSATQTADMGIFVRRAGTLFAPDFQNHPGGTATGSLGTLTPWTPVSLSAVTGSGTSAAPFTVTVVADAAATGLRLTMTVTYVNGENFFRKTLAFSSPGAQTFDAFLGGDIFLAASDSGVPYTNSGSVGGQDCATPPTYTILFIPLTPANRFSAENFGTVWAEIGAGTLSNLVASGCQDNGAALQWQNRTIAAAGGSVQIQAATSFGAIPTIANFRVDSVTANQGQPGTNLTVTVTGVGFQAGTTFNFGSGITVNSTTINSSTQATVTLSIAAGATLGFRDVIGTQTSGGLTSTLINGFQVVASTAPPPVVSSPQQPIPTLSEWGLFFTALLLVLGAWRSLGRNGRV
jgi:IPTL-CTERM motif/Quinohemoprotein amine dehydrogenase, alpha subunit domain III